MKRYVIPAVIASGLIAIAGCSSSSGSSSSSQPTMGASESSAMSAIAASANAMATDAFGQTCLPDEMDAQGYCPGDDPAIDPNGQTCAPSSTDSQGYCPGDKPTPTMTKQTDIVVFSVSGNGEPSIQYGDGATTNNPSDGAGPLGDGVYLPWHASMNYSAGAFYYAVTAQLEGYGSIQDTVSEQITTYCSNGHIKTETFPLANGSASGGYGIATAEYTGGDTGNASQAESDAGC